MALNDLLEKIRNQTLDEKEFDRYLDAFPQKMLEADCLADGLEISKKELNEAHLLAFRTHQKGNYGHALPLFRFLVILNPYVEPFWEGVASCLVELGRNQKALKALAVWALLDETTPLPHYRAGLIYKDLGEKLEAKKAFSLALEKAANHQELQARLNEVLEAL